VRLKCLHQNFSQKFSNCKWQNYLPDFLRFSGFAEKLPRRLGSDLCPAASSINESSVVASFDSNGSIDRSFRDQDFNFETKSFNQFDTSELRRHFRSIRDFSVESVCGNSTRADREQLDGRLSDAISFVRD
jgi:hypothetical protein